MNNLYFACTTCKNYINAGYRWFYWTLVDTKLVGWEGKVNVESVLNTQEYWVGKEKEKWLAELLPKVESFLIKHRTHDLRYGEQDSFFEDEIGLLWLYESDQLEEITPRTYTDILGFTSWDQVVEYVNNQPLSKHPWWWDVKDLFEQAHTTFNKIINHSF
jgi:hypothetical protein